MWFQFCRENFFGLRDIYLFLTKYIHAISPLFFPIKFTLEGDFQKNSGDADKLLEGSMIVFLVNLYTNGKKKTIGSHHRVKTKVREFFGKASIFFRKIKMEQKVLTEDPKSSDSDFL